MVTYGVPLESGDNHNYSSSSEDENSVRTLNSDTGGYTCALISISMIFTSMTYYQECSGDSCTLV